MRLQTQQTQLTYKYGGPTELLEERHFKVYA